MNNEQYEDYFGRVTVVLFAFSSLNLFVYNLIGDALLSHLNA